MCVCPGGREGVFNLSKTRDDLEQIAQQTKLLKSELGKRQRLCQYWLLDALRSEQ
jgi:hypothetical protein